MVVITAEDVRIKDSFIKDLKDKGVTMFSSYGQNSRIPRFAGKLVQLMNYLFVFFSLILSRSSTNVLYKGDSPNVHF